MLSVITHIVVLGATTTSLAIVRSAHALGLDCTVIDVQTGPAMYSRYAKAHVVALDNLAAVIELILASGRDGGVALIADSDAWLRRLQGLRDILESAFIGILHPNNEVLDICLNKTQFLRWCAAEQILAPRLYTVQEALQACTDTPVMVRPETTLHGQNKSLPKAIEVRSRDELQHLLTLYAQQQVVPCISASLLQPAIRQYSVGAARDTTGAMQIFVAEKVRPTAARCAGGTFVVSAPDERVAALAQRVLLALNYYGIAEIEILEHTDTQALYVVEVNARPWVQYELARRAGFDFLAFLLQTTQSPPALKHVAWLSFWDDAYVCFARAEGMVTTGELSFGQYMRSVLTARVSPFWSWRDPHPAVHITLQQLARIGRRVLKRRCA